MAISAADKKIIALSGGLIAGGQVSSTAAGSESPVGVAGFAAKSTGMLGLSYIGGTELLKGKAQLTRAMMMHQGREAKRLGGAVSSSARKAAPGLKLLAGRIAQGANRII
jgi:hypothetical protein